MRLGRALGFDDDRVRFVGTRSDLPALFGLAEVVWVTRQHGGANLTLEAMAAGVPVVAFRTPAVSGVVEDNVTGRLVPPGDRVRLAAVTIDLLDDPAARGRLGLAARAVAESRFPAAAVVDGYARLYHDVVSAGH
jgi:glycosyltransferase involved in cell wall biosynthesis